MDINPERALNNPILASFLGAVVGLRFAPGLTWIERVGNVAAGMVLAVYAAPALTDYLQVAKPGMLAGLSFAVGLFGLSLAAAVTNAIRQANLAEWAGSWLRRKG